MEPPPAGRNARNAVALSSMALLVDDCPIYRQVRSGPGTQQSTGAAAARVHLSRPASLPLADAIAVKAGTPGWRSRVSRALRDTGQFLGSRQQAVSGVTAEGAVAQL